MIDHEIVYIFLYNFIVELFYFIQIYMMRININLIIIMFKIRKKSKFIYINHKFFCRNLPFYFINNKREQYHKS